MSLREYHQKPNFTRNAQKILTFFNFDDILLLKVKRIAHCLWKLTRIIELIPSRDGIVRAQTNEQRTYKGLSNI